MIKTPLHLVPTLGVIQLDKITQISDYFTRTSEFDETQLIEGVYIRIDDDHKLLHRAKGVAPHFVAGLTKAWDREGIRRHKN